MADAQCPLCYSHLDVTLVAPCMECGHLSDELQHFRDGLHSYAEVEIGGGLCLVLCNICQADLGSLSPEYFGLPESTRIGVEHMRLVCERHDVQIEKDKYCASCGHRYAWLRAVADCRQRHFGGA